jgi:hypothetical protein
MTDQFIIYDERAMTDIDSATVICCEDTREEAVETIEELGHPAVIQDSLTGNLEHYIPKVMREKQ